MHLEGSDAERKAVTKRKLQAMESLAGRYNRVIALGDGEWGIASLDRISTVFRSFAEEIERQPPPPGLDENGTAQYRRAIAGVTAPMYSRAAESVKKAYEKGLALDVTSPVFITISHNMTRLAPRQHPPAYFGGAGRLKLMGPQQDDVESWRARVAAKAAGAATPSDALWVELGNVEMAAKRPRLARLYFEEALSRNAKSAAAANNLAVLSLMGGEADEGTQALIRALSQAEFAGEPKENLARTYLAYNLFPKAYELLRALRTRYPEDKGIATALSVAELGSGSVAQARGRLESQGAKDSDDFVLWYNWAVASALSEGEEQRRKGVEKLKDGSAPDAASGQALGLARSLFGNGR
jgi:tetratricopeptide (TPR) repeat protein